MTSNHAGKNRARRAQQRTGAAYTSAALGTLHQHDGGPQFTAIDGAGYGADRIVPMNQATALIAATVARCVPCQQTLTTAIAGGDPVVLAALASVLGLTGPLGAHLSPASRVLHPSVRFSSMSLDFAPIMDAINGMNGEERADLVRDCASVWAAAAQAQVGPLIVALTPTTLGATYRLTDYVEAPHTTGPLPALVLTNDNEDLPYDHLEQCGWGTFIPRTLPPTDPAWKLDVDASGTPTAITAQWPGLTSPFRFWTAAPEAAAAPERWRQLAASRQYVLLLGPWHVPGDSWKRVARDGELYVARVKIRRPSRPSAATSLF